MICSVDAGGEAGGAGGAAPPAGGAAPPAGGGTPAFYESFADEALKTSPSVQNFKTVEELARGYVNAEKRLGVEPARLITLPSDPKDEAAMREVMTKLGLPEKPEGYGLKLEALPAAATPEQKADYERSEGLLNRFTEHAHKAGMPAPLAKAAMDFWMAEVKRAGEEDARAFESSRAAGEAELKKEWGAAFEQRKGEIGRMLTELGDPSLAAAMAGDKLFNNPAWAKFLGKVYEKTVEPGTPGGLTGEGATNINGAVTPSQAKAMAIKLEADPAFRDEHHPMHKAVVGDRNRYLRMAEGVQA